MPAAPILPIAAMPGDPDASQAPPRWAARRRAGLIAIGLSAYALALVATWPARFVLPDAADRVVAGTIWSGEALIGGGHRVVWRWAPLRSLANLAFAVDWRLTGEGSDLGGAAIVRGRGLRLDDVAGQAGGGLIALIAPNLPVTCDVTMQVDMPLLVTGGDAQRAIGEVRSSPATCTPRGIAAAAFPVPRLVATMRRTTAGSEAWISPADGARRKLVTATLTSHGHLVIAVTRDGGEVLPFARGLALETDL